jgi:TetR/AcrR family transcriptional regulator, transcriptional repressor for nem operon
MINTRDHILNVSFNLFLQKSFKEVTLKEIVEKTGMSKGAFYHYFESKEQLFLEIINNAISSVVEVYKTLKKESLYQFYHDYLNTISNISKLFPNNNSDNKEGLELNIFFLFFDAIKLFPHFHEKLHESMQAELNAWNEVVHIARSTGEIKSSMSDEQITKMFVYSADGVSMHNIITQKSREYVWNKLLELWDAFYQELKS